MALRRDVSRLEKALKNVDNRTERSEEKNKQLLKEKSDLEQKLASMSKDKKENAKRLQLVQDQVCIKLALSKAPSRKVMKLTPEMPAYRARKKKLASSACVRCRENWLQWKSS